MNPCLSIKNLQRSFGNVQALKGISFDLYPGEFVGLIGHNGAGKTTALKIITGQLPASGGSVLVQGLDISEDPVRARRLIGYTPEQPDLYDFLTAREFLNFVAEVREAKNIDEALELAGLGQDADRMIREYSQGMRRKTALAGSIIGKPPVIILDEAMNGLDPPSAMRVKKHLRSLCDNGQTVLLSTHVLETVEKVADRVIMIGNGMLLADVMIRDLGENGLEKLFMEKIK